MRSYLKNQATFRLADHLAKSRLLYPSPLIGAPSVMVIDVPEASRGSGLPLARYYPIIVETPDEHEELERFITKPRHTPMLPDLLDTRPAQLWAANVLISRYEPPVAGWPWLCVAYWPEAFACVAADRGVEMARGCYTMELFERSEELETHCEMLVRNLRVSCDFSVQFLSADRIAGSGSA